MGMDWNYISRENAKDNINALALDAIGQIVFANLPDEVTMERKYERICGIMYFMAEINESLAEKEKEDDE